MSRHWLCDLSMLPEGSCNAFTVDGRRIAVYRVGGELFATQNHCTHKGAQLVRGRLEGSVIECAQHGWRFDVRSGTCLSPGHGRRLRRFAVSVEGSSVYVDLEAEVAAGASSDGGG